MTATHSPIKKIAIVLLWLIPTLSFAQITVDTSITTEQLVQDVLINGTCAETSNFSSFTGTAVGINGIAAFDASGTNFPFSGGVVLTSGDVNTVPGPNTNTAGGGGWPGDADLEAFTGATATNDASWIQFDFVPLTEQLSFDFIMASEEYNQNFECTFSDAFAFILTDQTTGVSENLAVLPGTTTPIQVTNIRPEVVGQCGAVNEEFFGQYNFAPFNDANTSPTNMNGQTVELTATSTVVIGNTYTIKLVVADSQDTAFNMAVFIEAGSFNIGSTDLGENLLVASGNAPCEGDTVTLDATDPDATSYTWFFNDVEIAGETNPTLDVTVAGEYGVEVTLVDLEDCVVRDDIIVEFINGDAVNLGDDLDVCEGETETLSVGPFGGDTTYVWLLDGMEIAGETNPTLDVTAAGNYTVQVTFPAGCTFSDDAMATIVPTPTLDLGEDLNSCFDEPVTLDGTPDNVDPAMATYQWFLDGFAIGGATNVTFDATQAGVYTVEVTLGDCTGSDSLTINQANPDGTSCIANDLCFDAETVACGDVITGSTEGATTNDAPGTCGTTGGAPGVWYSFIGTGNIIELGLCNSNYDTKLQVFEGACDALVCVDGNDDSCGLQSEVTFLSTPGTEYFIYVFGFGSSQGDYELTVNCVCDLSVDAGPDQVLCPGGDPFVLEAIISGETAANPVYEWSTGETTSTITVSMPGTYTVEVTTDGDCIATDEVIIEMGSPDDPECNIPDGDTCEIIDAGPDQEVSCDDPCVDLTAAFFGIPNITNTLPTTETSSYTVGMVDCPLPPVEGGDPTNITTDDIWSGVINIPFTFSYFNTDYTSLVVGANGQISFNTTLANNANGWSFEPDELLPFNDEAAEPGFAEFPFNTIYGAYHDINPGTNGDPSAINYFVSGTAPFRTFVLSFNGVPQFSCSDLLTTQQIILYETFNVIDVNIINKPVCSTWNDGLAVIGLMGNNLTEFSVPPGRNTGAWEASDESWRFLPDGETTDPTVVFEWTDEDGNVISTNPTVNVCPTEDTVYTATISVLDDAGNVIGGASDTVTVTVNSTDDFSVDLGEDQLFCDEDSYEIQATLEGNNIANASILWSTGETTESITVTETGTYDIEVTLDGCIRTGSVFIQLGQTPIFDLGSDLAVCFDVPTILDASPTNVDPSLATYRWFQDGVELADVTATLEVLELGTYEVIVEFEDCAASDSIVVSQGSIAVSLQDGFQTCPDETQTLVATTDGNNVTYEWSLNGTIISGATSSTLDITLPPNTLGEQLYQVRITQGICEGFATVPVTLYDVDNCTITQGISPSNLDGLNDTLDLTFLADRTGIENLQIFNRHGRLVFEQSNYIDQWRGQTNEDVDLPTGTYFYVINFSGEDPEYGRQSTGWIYLNQE